MTVSRKALPELMAALKGYLWSEHNALPKVSTLDCVNYQCFAVDAENPMSRVQHLPTGVGIGAETGERDAVETFLQALGFPLPHEGAWVPADRAEALKTLADLFADGVVLGLDGSVVDVTSGDTMEMADEDFIAPERPLPHAAGGRP